MNFRIRLTTALLCCAAVIATDRTATAQSQSTTMQRSTAAPAPPRPGGGMPGAEMLPTPMSSGDGSQEYYPSASGDSGYSSGGCADGFCDQGYSMGPSCGCETGCDSGSCCNLCGPNGGQFFFTADYLSVRASFSEATAKVVEDLNAGTDVFVPLDFSYD